MPKSCARVVDKLLGLRGNGHILYPAVHTPNIMPVHEAVTFPHIPQFFPRIQSTPQGRLFDLLVVGLSTVCTALITRTILVHFFSYY